MGRKHHRQRNGRCVCTPGIPGTIPGVFVRLGAGALMLKFWAWIMGHLVGDPPHPACFDCCETECTTTNPPCERMIDLEVGNVVD